MRCWISCVVVFFRVWLCCVWRCWFECVGGLGFELCDYFVVFYLGKVVVELVNGLEVFGGV